MKPLRLQLQAFGPFAEREVVDFGKLGSHTLFLIHGPTGAGKSTLLDGISFALFGRTSGGEREGAAMRSHLAARDLTTEVVFDFALRGDRYRVLRAPSQDLPKRRGEGLRRVQPRAVLWRRTACAAPEEAGQVLAEKERQVTEQVKDLLGFDHHQFQQVVVLPQGKFRELLTADSRARQKLLELLFQAEYFRRIEEALAAEAREGEGKIREERNRLETLLQQEGVADEEALRRRRAEGIRRLAEARAEGRRLSVREAGLEKELLRAREQEARLRERDAAEAAFRSLEAAQEAWARKEALLKRLVRAAPLQEMERTVLRLKQAAWEAAGRAQKRDAERAEAEAQLLRARLALEAAWRRASKRRDEERARLSTWKARVRQAREEIQRLEEAWVASQAARLATGLAPGEPCPVCGAREHPRPARGKGDPLEKEEALRKARYALSRLEEKAGDLHADAAAAEKEAERLEALLVARAREEEGVEGTVSVGPPPGVEKAREIEKPALPAEAAESALHEAERKLAALEKSAHDLVEEARRAAKAAAEADTRFEEARRSMGFTGLDEYEEAREALSRQAELEEEVKAFHARLAAAKARMARARAEAEGITTTDRAAVEAALATLRKEKDLLASREGVLQEQLRRATRTLEAVKRGKENLRLLEERYGRVANLSRVAGGRNPRGITFQRYVLAAFLDDVLASASRRLKTMSRGRYELYRVPEPRDRRQAAGLDLDVFDGYTGTRRPVNTLSGGEGFMASLSLALGLADMVQSFAGGIRLDTVFIDEGFGSLDEESLDQALRVLVDLQEGGRLTGIISHVPELRERIDARIEVIRGPRGSRTRIVC